MASEGGVDVADADVEAACGAAGTGTASGATASTGCTAATPTDNTDCTMGYARLGSRFPSDVIDP